MLAAHRAHLKTVILPKQNEYDLEEIPEEVRKALKFILVEKVDEVFKNALQPASKKEKHQVKA